MTERVEVFPCRHSPEGDAEADALLAEVSARLAGGSDQLAARPIPPEDLMTAIIASLEWGYEVHEIRIHYDQWGMVSGENDQLSVVAQFDRFEDGLAALWKAFADRR